jgi:hypothetical protein
MTLKAQPTQQARLAVGAAVGKGGEMQADQGDARKRVAQLMNVERVLDIHCERGARRVGKGFGRGPDRSGGRGVLGEGKQTWRAHAYSRSLKGFMPTRR